LSDGKNVALAPYRATTKGPSIEDQFRVKVTFEDQSKKDWSFDDLVAFDKENRTNLREKAISMTRDLQAGEDAALLLENGGWRKAIGVTLDELIAGETYLKWLLFYSMCSSGLKDRRLHLLSLGDSQQGKSFTQEQVGFNLAPDILIYASAMSAKAPYYEAAAKSDPHIYDHKVLLVDEFKNLSDSTKATIKAITSNGKQKITNKTVDINRQYVEQTLEGMPVVWANSAEVFDDPENQISNRYLKINVDESQDQSRRIEQFQKDKEALGPFRQVRTTVPQAKAIASKIMEEKDFEVVNLFAYGLEQEGRRARNVLPMFSTLVASIAYANRFHRPRIDLTDGRKVLFATLTDNEEAACIWAHYNGTQATGVANRHIRVLSAMYEEEEYSVEDAAAAYNIANPERPISTKTCADYLSELASKNLVISRRDDHSGRYLYSKMSSQLPKSSQLVIGRDYRAHPEILDEALDALKKHASQFPNLKGAELGELRSQLIDSPSEHLISLMLGCEQTGSPNSVGSDFVLLNTKVQGVKELLSIEPLTLEQIEAMCPSLLSTATAMKERGMLSENLAGELCVR